MPGLLPPRHIPTLPGCRSRPVAGGDRGVLQPLPALARAEFRHGRAFVDAQPVHFEDVLAELDYDAPTLETLQSVTKYRSFLGVPIFRDGRPIGVIGCGRREVRPFTATQIALVKTFAEQAVIAITGAETYRELQTSTNDLQESLEYQTATSDVLNVTSRSTFDLHPVFETIVATAARLCEADSALITNREGEAYRVAATLSFSPEYDAFIRGRVLPVGRGTMAGRTVLEGQVVHMPISHPTRNRPWPRR